MVWCGSIQHTAIQHTIQNTVPPLHFLKVRVLLSNIRISANMKQFNNSWIEKRSTGNKTASASCRCWHSWQSSPIQTARPLLFFCRFIDNNTMSSTLSTLNADHINCNLLDTLDNYDQNPAASQVNYWGFFFYGLLLKSQYGMLSKLLKWQDVHTIKVGKKLTLCEHLHNG